MIDAHGLQLRAVYMYLSPESWRSSLRRARGIGVTQYSESDLTLRRDAIAILKLGAGCVLLLGECVWRPRVWRIMELGVLL